MKQEVVHILKKIHYIEADMEIQKQILHSIPSANIPDIEKTLQAIAGLKKQVTMLKADIEKVDPDAYGYITKLEEAMISLRKIMHNKKFSDITTWQPDTPCVVALKSGERLNCLIKASQENGGLLVVTFDGTTREITPEEMFQSM
ncbi:MAG: hypothetical protein HQK66_09775 [Desulfamplus sp.]|nr:hypothetical protein [Desulfamplus sp.]